MVQSHLPPFQNLGNFVTPHLRVSFGRDTKSRWSLLSGVYASGSKISDTGYCDSIIVDSKIKMHSKSSGVVYDL